MREIMFRGKAANREKGRSYRTSYKNGDWVYGLLTDTENYAGFAEMTNTNGVAVLRWIPVTERLPGPSEKVLICSLIGNQYVAQHLHGHFYVDGCNIGASHWMPLPQPPKGD